VQQVLGYYPNLRIGLIREQRQAHRSWKSEESASADWRDCEDYRHEQKERGQAAQTGSCSNRLRKTILTEQKLASMESLSLTQGARQDAQKNCLRSVRRETSNVKGFGTYIP